MSADKYDTAFLGILQNEGQIARFLDVIFSFLYRRTDFYVMMKEPTAKMGFPPGVAKKLVLTAFKHYEDMAHQMMKRHEEMAQQKAAAKMEATETPPVAVQEEVTTTDAGDEVVPSGAEPTCNAGGETSSTSEMEPTTHSNDGETHSADTVEQSTPDAEVKSEPMESSGECTEILSEKDEETSEKDGACGAADGASGDQSKESKEDGSDDEELARMQKVYQENPESYNGAIRDHYSWSQSITDLDVHVKVPKYISKGKDVQVEVLRKHLRCGYRDESGQWKMTVNEDLTWDINKEESMWSLVPGEHIHVNLEKVQERWWEAVLVSEPKISVRKIDPSRPITDLDGAAQSKVEEMMYNEQQKRLGLPQTHEKKTHEILKSAWDAEGSPFKGQPFDPSRINVSPSDGSMMNMPK